MVCAAKEFDGGFDPIRVVAPARGSGGGGLAYWLLEGWRRWTGRGRNGGGKPDGRQLVVLESLFVGPRQRVHLLRCGGEHFLVATGVDGVSNLVPVGAGAVRSDDPQVVGLPTYGDERWN